MSTTRARRIVLSGCDGSGKSTIALALASVLSRRRKTSLSWLRGSHLHVSLLYRFLSRFSAFKGPDNPYYGVSVPENLKHLFSVLEFAGFLPQLFARWLRGLYSDYLVCDRGVLDFLAWVVATLKYAKFLNSLLGRFLLALSAKEAPIVLAASLNTLAARADVPLEFLAREYAIYSVLQKYVSRCTVDTSSTTPLEALKKVLECLSTRSAT